MKFYTLILSLLPFFAISQSGVIKGTVLHDQVPLPTAHVSLLNSDKQVYTDASGEFIISGMVEGLYTLDISHLGFYDLQKKVQLSGNEDTLLVTISMEVKGELFDQVVVTGTKTFKRKTNSPVIVNVLSKETMDNVQACNLSEGLKFQPGLRVETDCQTCNYTQLRMNGLAGGYSQILINGRPIFSPLTGLYGLEQLPVNMIERIEVIRGGGSTLYGSSAIGGTVNVITRIPEKNDVGVNYFYQNVNGQTDDHNMLGNATLVSDSKNTGISLFLNHRNRGLYDHNQDNFSELPEIRNTSWGANFFHIPSEDQKLEINISNLNEYRYGGEMVDEAPHLTKQSEERKHNVWMGSADYQINFNEERSSFISYLAWQNTDRDHYTGIFPDEEEAIQEHLSDPPYGDSRAKTYQAGFQFNHEVSDFIGGSNVFTLGGEYVVDDIFDEIPAYNYLVDQTTRDLGVFVQSDWKIFPFLNLLSGVRADHHNLVDPLIFSPRASLLYKLGSSTQFRFSYGTGFRAPQAFDADLHIAFAGGGVSRVVLSPDLKHENSESFSTSVNYDKVSEKYIAGFTLEAFHTRLNDAFVRESIGEDQFGEVFEKRNGQGALVQGLTLELRANYDQKAQLEAGFTLQESLFDESVTYIEGINPTRAFMRTPNDYGFANLNLWPSKNISCSLNWIYTGRMQVPHFGGAPNQAVDEIITSDPFHELNLKASYTLPFTQWGAGVEIYGGIKNIFNAYQNDFDTGKNRDSNFIYGPGMPRTLYVGVKVRGME